MLRPGALDTCALGLQKGNCPFHQSEANAPKPFTQFTPGDPSAAGFANLPQGLAQAILVDESPSLDGWVSRHGFGPLIDIVKQHGGVGLAAIIVAPKTQEWKGRTLTGLAAFGSLRSNP